MFNDITESEMSSVLYHSADDTVLWFFTAGRDMYEEVKLPIILHCPCPNQFRYGKSRKTKER